MANALEPGAGGLVSASPRDQVATGAGRGAPPPSPMAQHFASPQAQAKAKFAKVKEMKELVDATKRESDKLVALGDTVTMDDVIDAAAGMIAAGAPADQMAGTLAGVPDQPGQIQGWVQEQAEKLGQMEQKVDQALAVTGHTLAKTSLLQVIGHSAEAHHAHRMARALAALTPAGRA